jgi:hypothetical protein
MRRAASLPELGAPTWEPPLGLERVRYDPNTGEVLQADCRAPIGGAYYEAWVFSESYRPQRCRGGIGGFFTRLWDGITGRDYEPLRPLIGGRERDSDEGARRRESSDDRRDDRRRSRRR